MTLNTDIALLNPSLQILCRELMAQCTAQRIKMRITETWRDPAREDYLHDQGITRATGQTCKHCCLDAEGKPSSKAFDFALFDNTGAYITNGSDHRYYQVGQLAKGLGMIWGGDFKRPDYDHCEIS